MLRRTKTRLPLNAMRIIALPGRFFETSPQNVDNVGAIIARIPLETTSSGGPKTASPTTFPVFTLGNRTRTV
jgi:hypothetical protein